MTITALYLPASLGLAKKPMVFLLRFPPGNSTGIREFQIKIDEVTKNLENSHRSALRKVRTLKEKMNVLELKLGEKRSDGPKEDLDELNSAVEKLNRLTDALISECKSLGRV